MMKRSVLLLMLLVAALISACGGVDVTRIISVEGADPTEMPMGDSGVEIIPLTQSAVVFDDISVSYPPDWAARITEFDGTILANNQAALDAFDNSDLPDYNVIGEGNVVMVIQAVPVLDATDATGFFYELLRDSAEEDGQFTLGEAREVTVGENAGLLAPLTILDEASGVGLTDVYILQVDAENLVLALVVAPGDEIPTSTAEMILASIPDGLTVAAEVTEPTESAADSATSTMASPTLLALPTATEMAMEPAATMEFVALTETLVGDLFTLNYPAGWVAESNFDGIRLASSQGTFEISETPAVSQFPDGETAMQVSILPFAVSDGTPAEIFDLLFAEVSEDDPFMPGERSDVNIGGLSGVTSSLEFAGDVEGSGALYILRYDDDNLLLAISLFGGTSSDIATVEAIIASLRATSAGNAP